ncbi:MAG: NAD-dependent deacylase [Deltaproteobacteria bacterium]|nr:NAD-dependent deacylase [Deltaproteobacteria bacterium]
MDELDERLKQAAQILYASKHNVVLTGAGISVESGIPDFRSPGGLWERYDIMEYGTISAFRSDPEKVWKMLSEMEDVVRKARPNAAHKALAQLERWGVLDVVITQNIDGLHQDAGSGNVIEFHGNSKTLTCLWCHRRYGIDEVGETCSPRCECGRYLKPDVVLFGEAIPADALNRSFGAASSCGALLVIGTSAQVAPASTIPVVAKRAGAVVIEINLAPSLLTSQTTDVFLQGRAASLVPALVERVGEILGDQGRAVDGGKPAGANASCGPPDA